MRAKDLIPTLPLLGLRTREGAGSSRLKAQSGGVKYPVQVAPTTGSLILGFPPDPRWRRCSKVLNLNWFDFIECFMTTFLRAHSWLNWVDEDDDEDEVGLKEKPEDPRYINKRPLGLTAPLSNCLCYTNDV